MIKQILKIGLILQILMTFALIKISSGQTNSLKCNTSIVLEINENIDSLSDNLMLSFLMTFSEDCNNNIEYSEFSNETLFKVIQKEPELFCKTLDKNYDKIDIPAILFELESPLHDLIILELTKKEIEKIEISNDLKNQLLKSICTAIIN